MLNHLRSLFFVLLIALIFATVKAQAPFMGTWQTSIPLGNGLPVATGIFIAQPDGSYREEMLVEGQLAAFWEGRYTLSPDGTLTQTIMNKSPQICVQGNCVANDDEGVTVVKISFQGPDTIRLGLPDGTRVLDYQRVAGNTPIHMPLPDPLNPNPLNPNPNLPATPVNPWMGTYTDGDLTLVMAGPGKDYIERAGVRYPLQLQGTLERLEGSFSNEGTNYPVVLELSGKRVLLTSGESRFELGLVQTSNPLD